MVKADDIEGLEDLVVEAVEVAKVEEVVVAADCQRDCRG
jgi:DNA-binding protein YbaB